MAHGEPLESKLARLEQDALPILRELPQNDLRKLLALLERYLPAHADRHAHDGHHDRMIEAAARLLARGAVLTAEPERLGPCEHEPLWEPMWRMGACGEISRVRHTHVPGGATHKGVVHVMLDKTMMLVCARCRQLYYDPDPPMPQRL